MDGFQVRCSFMIAVEAAAGAVFLHIIKPKLWVRRDGLSLDLQRSRGFPNTMLPPRASVAAEHGQKKNDDAHDRCDSCSGRYRSRGRPSRGAGR